MRKTISVILAVFMLFTLTACKNGGGKPSDLDIKLNGVTVTAPLTVEKLGSDYTVENANLSINYKGELIAGVIFDKNSTESDYRKKKIKTLMSIVDGGTKSVSVNGITTGSAQSEVIKAIGKPVEKSKELAMWVYREDGKPHDENYLLITFDEDKKVLGLIVSPE